MQVTPLMLQVPLEQLLQRRRHVFAQMAAQNTDWGIQVDFTRKVRPTVTCPAGRVITGSFAIVAAKNPLCLLVSTLSRDAHTAGPRLLSRKAYPLARRPFFASAVLGRVATAIDAMGYDRDRRFRRDMKEQSIDEALAEMREQDRYVHRLEVSFVDDSSVEAIRASFDRHASVSIRRGDVRLIMQRFVLPAMMASASRDTAYDVRVAPKPQQQEALQLSFPNEPFATNSDLSALCKALRKGDGLAVTVIHLNPYLQAQVIDMLTGLAADMVVLDKTHVSLIPRSSASRVSLERMATTLFRYFGEGELERVPITS